jgi:hypothetical protein
MFLQLNVPPFLRSQDAIGMSPANKIALPSDLKERSAEKQAELGRDFKYLSVYRMYEYGAHTKDLVLKYPGRAEVMYLERIMREPWSYGLSPVRCAISIRFVS